MIVAVRSEIDSRPLVYPMIRVLKNYGSVCFISSNRQCRRLMENEDEGGFRNIRVLVEESGAVDEVYTDNGITKGDFDFIILDNMGLMDYDMLFVPVSEFSSADFQEEIELLKTDAKVRFVQFGGSTKTKSRASKSKPGKPSRPNKRGEANDVEEENPEDKFALKQTIDEEYNVAERYHNVAWPTWKEIEDFESLNAFMKPEKGLSDALYTEFKNVIGIDKRVYDKEVARDDLIEKGSLDVVPTDIDKGAPSESRRSSGPPSRRRAKVSEDVEIDEPPVRARRARR